MKDPVTYITISLREDNKRIVIRAWGKVIYDHKNKEGIDLRLLSFRKNRRRKDVFPDGLEKPSWVKQDVWDRLSEEEKREEVNAKD